eukprot:scaffold24_cov341-Pavlova_lutheri.AAC.97
MHLLFSASSDARCQSSNRGQRERCRQRGCLDTSSTPPCTRDRYDPPWATEGIDDPAQFPFRSDPFQLSPPLEVRVCPFGRGPDLLDRHERNRFRRPQIAKRTWKRARESFSTHQVT